MLLYCGSGLTLTCLPHQACAVGLIVVGIAVQLVLNQTITHGATPGTLLPVVIIVVGAFLFLVAFVGCCGTCKENYCLMITVSGMWASMDAWEYQKAFLWLGLTRVGKVRTSGTFPGTGWARAGLSHPDSKPDSCPLLLQFAIFLTLIMLVEVAVAIAGYVFKDKVSRA